MTTTNDGPSRCQALRPCLYGITQGGRASPPLAGPRRHSAEIRWEGGISKQDVTPGQNLDPVAPWSPEPDLCAPMIASGHRVYTIGPLVGLIIAPAKQAFLLVCLCLVCMLGVNCSAQIAPGANLEPHLSSDVVGICGTVTPPTFHLLPGDFCSGFQI
ncbi:hypothetical protein Bbelb_152980 [Branchiostoma belcheri]|nr:hypothetical protein Bbelb_152980 [Branchiostoma belcheri]